MKNTTLNINKKPLIGEFNPIKETKSELQQEFINTIRFIGTFATGDPTKTNIGIIPEDQRKADIINHKLSILSKMENNMNINQKPLIGKPNPLPKLALTTITKLNTIIPDLAPEPKLKHAIQKLNHQDLLNDLLLNIKEN